MQSLVKTMFVFFSKGSMGTTFINQKMYWWYSFYAWTSPLLLTIGVFLNQMFYLENDTFKVDVGDSVCFLNTLYEEKCECLNCYNMKHKVYYKRIKILVLS